MNRSSLLLAGPFVVGMFLLAGCGDSGRSGSTGGEPWDLWNVELVTRIGSVDGRDDALSRVGQVLITPDSTLVLSQPTTRRLLEYDWRGRLVHRIGRRGEGPGEFGAIRAIGILRDTLYVSDHALDRVSYFDLEGEFIRSEGWVRERLSFSDEYFFSTTPPQVLRTDATAILQPSMGVTPTRGMGTGVNTAVYRTPYFHVGLDSRIIDTVAWRETREISVGLSKNGEDYFYPWPFAVLPQAGILPDGTGVVLAERGPPDAEGGYRLVKLGPTGDTAFTRTVVDELKRMPDAYRHREFERIADLYRDEAPDAPNPAEVGRAFENSGLDIETAAPVTALAPGQDGSIWIRREAGPPGSVVPWDVLDSADGGIEGKVFLPEGELIADASLDHVVTIGTGAFGIPIVSLYSVHR